MPTIVVRFSKPENITNPGFDGTVLRFTVVILDKSHLGTPREISEAKTVRIRVEISDSRSSTWNLRGKDLEKVLFQFAKEELSRVLSVGTVPSADLAVIINASTNTGACPFEVEKIQEPNSALIEIQVNRRIGFV